MRNDLGIAPRSFCLSFPVFQNDKTEKLRQNNVVNPHFRAPTYRQVSHQEHIIKHKLFSYGGIVSYGYN